MKRTDYPEFSVKEKMETEAVGFAHRGGTDVSRNPLSPMLSLLLKMMEICRGGALNLSQLLESPAFLLSQFRQWGS